MKFKGSKKLLSLFLAVLMVVSSVPAFALSASAAVNSTDVSALETAMKNYEAKMKGGKIYTNMLSAYKYYEAAQKAIDAVKYGYNSAIDVSVVANNLNNAVTSMTEWNAPTFTATAYHKTTEATDGYSSLVYAKNDDTWFGPETSLESKKLQSKVALPNEIVVCYDGSDAYIPIAGQFYQNGSSVTGRWWRSSGFSLKDSNVNYTAELKQNWRCVKNAAYDSWSSPTSSLNLPYKYEDDTSDCKYDAAMAYNRLYMTSKNTSTYYDSIDYSNFDIHNKFYLTWFISGKSYYDGHTYGSGTGYIINYKPLKERISTLSKELEKYSVANYTQGGLESLFSAIDACTAINPNSYDYASNVFNAVKNCGNAIKEAMGKTYSVTADDAKFQSLRDAIANSQTASTTKTADSLVEYGKAIKAGRDFFANLATYANNGDNAQSKADAITTAYNALVDAYSDSTKDNFDAAVTVVKAMNMDALTADGQAYIKKLIDTSTSKLTTTLTDSDKTYYALATGQSVDTAKNITDSAVDELTKALLTFAAFPDESYINNYTVSVGATIFNKGTETNLKAVDLGSKKYGEIVDINVNDLFSDVNSITDKTISWTVQYKDSNDNTVSNQKVRNDEPTISVKATANIVVTALVTDETKTDETTGYTVKFLDIYGKLADVAYTTDKPEAGSFDRESYTAGGKTYTPEIPFYTLKGFTVSSPDSNNVVTVRPTYTTEIRLGVTVYNGTAESSSLKSDNTVQKTRTVKVSSPVAHIGWAVVKGNEYQIVAYTTGDYQFVALGAADSSLVYTPIIEQNGGYAVYKDDATTETLTASNVYQFENNSAVSKDKVSDDAYLNAKIAAKAPFTYVEEYTTVDVNGTTMYRYYVRITAGSDAKLIGFGVEADTKKYSLTSKNDTTGQYSASFRSAKSNFKSYVSYSFTYSYGGTDYNISTADYATL